MFTALALTEAIYRIVSEGREAAASYFERLLGDLECSPAASSPIWWSSDGGAQRCARPLAIFLRYTLFAIHLNSERQTADSQ